MRTKTTDTRSTASRGVTMQDVARHAGVSSATVSRVLNRPGVVDEATRLQVRTAIETLRYRPNAVARGLASRSSRTIGIVINTFASPYYGAMLDGAEGALAALGYKAIVESSRERAEGEREAWLSLLDRQCEAVVVHSDNLDDAELAEWMERHPRAVLMNRKLGGFEPRCVHLDNRRGAALAADFLVRQGHERIAEVTGPDTFHEVRDREAGFADALRAAGILRDPSLFVRSDFQLEGGYAALVRLMDRPALGRPTAIFLHNDDMAAGALEACRERGIRVPDDVSIMGFDDLAIARHLVPKLTTIRQPLTLIGAAAGRLAHAIAVDSPERDAIPRVFTAEVVERASVSVPNALDPNGRTT